MKKSLLLSLLMLFVSAVAFANTGSQFGILSDDGDPMPNHIVSYDLRTGEPFVYNHTIEEPGYYIDNFSLPFAYDVCVSGGHLEFSVTNEDFRFYFLKERYSKNYYDLHINIYDGTYIGWGKPMYVSKDYIIRIMLIR